MQIKDGVNIQGIQLPMRKVFIHASAIWKENGQELVVTCGMDGEHSSGSWHYFGYAVDLRTHYFDNDTVVRVANTLRNLLGGAYVVIVHRDSHIHVHYIVSR